MDCGLDRILKFWGRELTRVIHHTLFVLTLSRIILHSFSLWKQQGGLNACSSVPETVKESNNSLYWELNTITVTQFTANANQSIQYLSLRSSVSAPSPERKQQIK
jgi:hypothetical protein